MIFNVKQSKNGWDLYKKVRRLRHESLIADSVEIYGVSPQVLRKFRMEYFCTNLSSILYNEARKETNGISL